ncbi:hypothetical protein [Peribacillus sp. NPDC058002]|uniref:hypothetical protein n=1 Tax=Peribacillus sp. NPDC058002 TaxID=3346301 RepID=UPI0036DC7910
MKEEDMFEFGSGFEIFIENSAVLEVKLVNVHSKEVIPTQVKSLTKTGEFSVKEMSNTML